MAKAQEYKPDKPVPVTSGRSPTIRQASGRGIIRIPRRVADALDNPDDVKTWDDEELRRGYRRDKNGNFTGRPPRIIPTVCYYELHRRILRDADSKLQNNLDAAVEALTSIITSPFADDHARLKAIQMVMDRVMGKAPDKVDMTVKAEEPEWMKALRKATVIGELPGAEQAEEAALVLDANAEEVAG